jgi:hypothetical protein
MVRDNKTKMSDGKLLKDFLKEQTDLMHKPVSKTPGKASKVLMNPESKAGSEEGSLAHIIEKKPAPTKVKKFIQTMIDEIVAEQED